MSMVDILTLNEQGWQYSNRISFSNPIDNSSMDVIQLEERKEEHQYKKSKIYM